MDRGATIEAACHRYVEQYNRCDANWVYEVHSATFTWTELPVHGVYSGKSGDREALRQLSQQTIDAFPGRRMSLLSILANADRAAIEVGWTGIAGSDFGDMRAGETVRLRQASFVIFDDALKIVSQVDYTVRLS